MLIVSDRRYAMPIGADELWAAIEDVERYRTWWPWLRRFDAAALTAGEHWRCTVQPPLPYVLRFTVELVDVQRGASADATITGDVSGTARLTIDQREEGCEARLQSELAPANRTLQAIARFARPVVQLGHDWVLDTGARQVRTSLRQGRP